MHTQHQVLGTFSFDSYGEYGPQSGVVTNFLDQDGHDVDSPDEAEYWVGLVMEGSLAGQWLNCVVDDEDGWEHRRVH